MEEFIKIRLSSLLGFDVPDEMIKHIMSLKTDWDVEDYCEGLLDKTNPKHKLFISDLLNKRRNSIIETSCRKSIETSSGKKRRSKNKTSNVMNTEQSEKKDITNIVAEDQSEESQHLTIKEASHKYKKAVFTPFNYDKKTPLLPGRRLCGCSARDHKILNNCLECGRIACEQEGSGPCFFCGNLVVSKKEKAIIDSGTEKGSSLIRKLLSQPKPKTKAYEDAVARRDQMRDADVNREERQKIIDDESDYFPLDANIWDKNSINKIESVKESYFEVKKDDFIPLAKIEVKSSNQNKYQQLDYKDGITEVACINEETERLIETFKELRMPELRGVNSSVEFDFDKNLWELNDDVDRRGVCLSLHQPYASLIVCGIKKHEGRTWKTNYRGPLWIASGVKEPSLEEIKSVESFYSNYYNDPYINFPTSYPTGKLLGRVSLVDCLPQSHYRQKYPNGESESKFVFILENYISLPVQFSISGKHKLYYLPKKLHTIAGLLIRNIQRTNKGK